MSESARTTEVKSIVCPFVIMIDSREQRPYDFLGIRAGADKGHAQIDVRTERYGLPVGDYTILDMPQICIERKSKEDLWSSISTRRENFEGRLRRMAEDKRYAAVVVEAEWWDVISNPPPFTQYRPVSLSRTLIAWRQRFRVDWWFAPNREAAEILTFRLLERWWLDHKEEAVS